MSKTTCTHCALKPIFLLLLLARRTFLPKTYLTTAFNLCSYDIQYEEKIPTWSFYEILKKACSRSCTVQFLFFFLTSWFLSSESTNKTISEKKVLDINQDQLVWSGGQTGCQLQNTFSGSWVSGRSSHAVLLRSWKSSTVKQMILD